MKRYGNQLQTGTAGVEKSLLRDVVLSHLDDLKVYGDDKLVKWVKAPKAPRPYAILSHNTSGCHFCNMSCAHQFGPTAVNAVTFALLTSQDLESA